MSYANYEYSVQDADPIFKFLFVVGDIEYRYTNAAFIVGDSSGSYLPEQITPGEFNNSNEFTKSVLPIKFPRTNEFAQLYIGGVPDQITTVTITRLHVSDADEEPRIFWQGRIVGISVSDDEITLECDSIFASSKRTGLYRRFSKGCTYDIYGEGCYVPKYDFAQALTITAFGGNVLTVAGAGAFEDGYFRGGEIELPNGVTRYITEHVGDSITLIRPIASLAELQDSNGEIQGIFYPGCNHTMSDCKNKFNNLPNHGGFPYFPGKNPFNNVQMF